jgi:glycine/D-amino acid oxidase-like deaminating enzyme
VLPGRSDAVVIGGGAMGAAALYYLTTLDCTNVLLVERDTLGAGSTGHCAGGVRTLFSDELNVRIGVESIDRLERFQVELGHELDLRLDGYLFLLDDPADVVRFEADLALQAEHGIDARLLEPDEAQAIVPLVDTEGLLAAVLCARAGIVTPDLVVQGYARAAAARGARIEQSCEVSRVVVENGRVAAVETARGTVETERVVLAAGVWSRELGVTCGLTLPLERERRFMYFTEPVPGLPERVPLTIDFSTGFYFHREGDGLAFGGREQTLDGLAPHAVRRLPVLEDVGVRASWWGYYELSPDHNALVGAHPGVPGLVYATGFSGHGFQQAPVVGEHLAELVLGREPTFDLSELDAGRFAAGAERVEQNVV